MEDPEIKNEEKLTLEHVKVDNNLIKIKEEPEEIDFQNVKQEVEDCFSLTDLKSAEFNHKIKKEPELQIVDLNIPKLPLREDIETLNKQLFNCQQCDYKCLSKRILDKHKLKLRHNTFTCNLCDYKCELKTDFTNHGLLHVEKKPISCNRSEYISTRERDLLKHKSLLHGVEKSFSCDQCEYVCLLESDLKMHTFFLHPEERPFSCDQCENKFKLKCILKMHKLRHVAKLSCDQCSYKCHQNCELKRHKLVHSSKKEFSCNKCDAKYKYKCDLKKHIKKNGHS